MVQRYLCGDSPKAARKALLVSGVVVFAQFALFLFIGAMLYVFYTGYATGEMAAFMVDGRVRADRIFPHFIVTHLPHWRSRFGHCRDCRRCVHFVAQLAGGDDHRRFLRADDRRATNRTRII